jgi:hypothetical protein
MCFGRTAQHGKNQKISKNQVFQVSGRTRGRFHLISQVEPQILANALRLKNNKKISKNQKGRPGPRADQRALNNRKAPLAEAITAAQTLSRRR